MGQTPRVWTDADEWDVAAVTDLEERVSDAFDAHAADTSSVHGITDTSVLELTTRKGVADGYAALGADGRVPVSQQQVVGTGNRVSMLGDSITGSLSPPLTGTNSQSYGPSSPLSSLMHAQPKVIPWGAFGVSGNTAAQGLARVTDVTSLAIKPDWCLVMFGTNDAGTSVSASSFAASMEGIADALHAAGIRPVFLTVPPVPTTDLGGGLSRRELADRYNGWLAGWCPRNGVPLADFRTAVMDTAGDWLPDFSTDGIHPTNPGYRAMALAFADLFDDLLPLWAPPFAVFASTSHQANLVPNPLFLSDANTDGTPDSWTVAGTGTSAIIASPGDPVVGRALSFTGNDGTFTQIAAALPAGCWAAGDRIAFCGRFKIDGTPTSGGAILSLNFTSASPSQTVRGFNGYGFDTDGWCTFYLEHICPSGSTTGQIALGAQGVGLDPHVAQLAVYNLTAIGLA